MRSPEIAPNAVDRPSIMCIKAQAKVSSKRMNRSPKQMSEARETAGLTVVRGEGRLHGEEVHALAHDLHS